MPTNDPGPGLSPAIPVVAQIVPALPAERIARAARIAERLRRADPALARTDPLGRDLGAGLGPWPSLVLEDHGAIALFETEGNLAYSYRALLLAGEGDTALIGVARSPAFEAYCAGPLGLGRPEILAPAEPAAAPSLAGAAEADAALLARLAERAQAAGGLNLVPYMSGADVWRLGARIAEAAGRPVRVAAPPPGLARAVNDKLWFAERVSELLGACALPETVPAHGFAALAGRVEEMAESHASLALKLTRSASSAGNMVLDLSELAGLSTKGLHARLRARLEAAGWSERFPVLVTAWERPVLASPSVQVWVPDPAAGLPVVEGVFDQITHGETAVFAGAEPTRLPEPWQRRLAEEAVCLSLLFQHLGYFGRCSFDAILVGETEAAAALHWIECNGRWGGTSLPMTLANRLIGDWRRAWPVILEGYAMDRPPRPLDAVLAEVGADLFDRAARPRGAVILSPGRLERAEGYELLVLEPSREAAHARAARVAATISGGAGG